MFDISGPSLIASRPEYPAGAKATPPAALEYARLFVEYFGLALIVRLILLGNPLTHVDEEFYLFMADRWAHGAVPFVDIWDRKPLGLFALYRLFLSLPGDPVLAYQVCGIASTAAAALVVRRLALELASPRGAWLAGLVYLCAMPAFNCALGQSPVFYNPLVALAALLLLRAWQRAQGTDLLRQGCVIMLLIGLALQIKYAAVFEGLAMGIMLLALGRRVGWPLPRLAGAALVWCGIALAPTMLVLGSYAAIDQTHAFVFANFTSVLERLPDGAPSWRRLLKLSAGLSPFMLCIAFDPLRRAGWDDQRRALAYRLLGLWAAAAVLGFLLFGTWYDHYAGPLVTPLAVLSAPALAAAARGGQPWQARWCGRFLILASAVGGVVVMAGAVQNHGTAKDYHRATALIRSAVHGGCYFQFDGAPALYRGVGACVPTRFAFPNHLNTWTESPAIGADPVAEVRRIMATRPAVVQVSESAPEDLYLPNRATRTIIAQALAQGYVRFAEITLGQERYALYRPR